MNRSEINAIMREGVAFMAECRFALPPFAFWTPDEWRRKGPECAPLVERQLGWDITDYGSGAFEKRPTAGVGWCTAKKSWWIGKIRKPRSIFISRRPRISLCAEAVGCGCRFGSPRPRAGGRIGRSCLSRTAAGSKSRLALGGSSNRASPSLCPHLSITGSGANRAAGRSWSARSVA